MRVPHVRHDPREAQRVVGVLQLAVPVVPLGQRAWVALVRRPVHHLPWRSPRQLELELTEGSLIENLERAQRVLAKLKAIGVGLSIDDFGTGYSSLSALQQFPIGTLKVDQSFVRDIGEDESDATIVASVCTEVRPDSTQWLTRPPNHAVMRSCVDVAD